MRISVVICSHSSARWHDLLAALDSVHSQRVPVLETIVVVDHNEALLERVRQMGNTVVAVSNAEQPGLSGARNSGISVAKGDVVAVMDDDAFAQPDWLEQLTAPYANPSVVGVGGAVEPLWARGRPHWFPGEFDWVVGCGYIGLPTITGPIRNFIGANMSFRRSVFESIGGFYSGLGRVAGVPLGCEETELCIRVREEWPDKTLLYEPGARVLHRVPESRASWAYFRARCYAEGRSKAVVTQLTGAGVGLASERTYAGRVLPRAAACAIADALIRREGAEVARALAIVAGLLLTGVGYAAGISLRLIQRTRDVSRLWIRSGPASPSTT